MIFFMAGRSSKHRIAGKLHLFGSSLPFFEPLVWGAMATAVPGRARGEVVDRSSELEENREAFLACVFRLDRGLVRHRKRTEKPPLRRL
jgi:hypothetical protein